MKGTTTYEIDLTAIGESRIEKDYHIGKEFFESMDNTDILGSDVDVALDIEKHHDAYKLMFHMEGSLEVPCDRCLDPVGVPVDTDYDVTVKYGEEYDDSEDNMLTIPYSQTRIDISSMIYDTLLLSIPLRCVHPAGGCNTEMSEVLREHNADSPEEDSETEDTEE